mmetsp:Transcript_36416/g.56545  ORF Transcript_36416/g.56545 Transcript_36416/m.56545 type:complete len:249 (-) Transcript_36416:343-1089(-)
MKLFALFCTFFFLVVSLVSAQPQDYGDDNPFCNICGYKKMITLPEAEVPIPVYGTHTCAFLHQKSKDGKVPKQHCNILQAFAYNKCGCEDKTDRPTGAPVPLPEPTASLAPSISLAPSVSASPSVSIAPTASPTDEPSASPTDEPSASPTDEPSASPTDEPSASPTDEPSASPTDEPTPAPTPAPVSAEAASEQTGSRPEPEETAGGRGGFGGFRPGRRSGNRRLRGSTAVDEDEQAEEQATNNNNEE